MPVTAPARGAGSHPVCTTIGRKIGDTAFAALGVQGLTGRGVSPGLLPCVRDRYRLAGTTGPVRQRCIEPGPARPYRDTPKSLDESGIYEIHSPTPPGSCMFAFCSLFLKGSMGEVKSTGYTGGETTGFQSAAQDHIEHVVDLSAVLDLGKPGMYPVRVVGQAFRERGILNGDILIANAAADPKAGKVVVAFIHGDVLLATLERRSSGWCLLPAGKSTAVEVSDDAEIWAVVSGLVRVKV